jgi:hypothetical protein
MSIFNTIVNAAINRNPTSPKTAENKKNGEFEKQLGSSDATNPPYLARVISKIDGPDSNPLVNYEILAVEGATGSSNFRDAERLNTLKAQYGEKLYLGSFASQQTTIASNPNSTQANIGRINAENPSDPRLAFAVDDKTGAVVYSMSATQEFPMVDGMIFKEKTGGAKAAVSFSDAELNVVAKDFYGIPSLMSPNSYINLQAAGGQNSNKYILEKENQPRFYNATEPVSSDGSGVQPSSAPTVSEIVNWSLQSQNFNKFPYRFTDFAFCKYWQKIPNNYMVTLRRYPYPVNDSVTTAAEARNEVAADKLKPITTMITYLGEDTGNKISSILGPVETGLKWKPLEAKVWDVSMSGEPASVNSPAAQLGKILGFLTQGSDGTKTQTPLPPIDPYSNGPYANKIIGPVNVIDSTMMRDRGLEFKHSISLVFEYSLRSIGGVNTKAAGLDIIGNCMLMTSASAPFWGGENRMVPYNAQGASDPFLGGKAGRDAWIKGSPEDFFTALKSQFTKIFSNVSDLFNKIFSNPIDGLQEIARGGSKEFMKMSTTAARQQVTGMHSIMTGAPVGEWHLTIGTPMNPMMMMGNMICKNGKLEFNDELGPDDFPTEIKFTVTLEHGMPRDKSAIESMFNKGRGRIYSLPKGYEASFASSTQSPIDTSIKSRYKYINNETQARSERAAENHTRFVDAEQRYNPGNVANKPVVNSVFASLYSQGSAYVPGTPTPTNTNS